MPFFRTLLTPLLFICLNCGIHAQDYSWDWATGLVGEQDTQVDFMDVDGQGNIYLIGRFQGKYLKMGWEELRIPDKQASFLIKLNPQGELLWKKNLSSPSDIVISTLKVDHLGNAVVTGTYASEYIYFLGHRLENYERTGGSKDAFITRISQEGKLLWAKSIGMVGNDEMIRLDLDGMGRPYVAFQGRYFDKGNEKEGPKIKVRLKNEDLTKSILKFSLDGALLWNTTLLVQQYQTTSLADMKVDFEGNLYLTGLYQGDRSRDHRYLEDLKLRRLMPDYKAHPVFMLKMNAQGKVLWVDQMPSTSFELDEVGNIFMMLPFSHFPDEIFLDIGEATLERQEEEEMALLSYDSEGNFLAYATFGLVDVANNQGGIRLVGPSSIVSFEYGMDGNVYVLYKVGEGEAIAGEHRIREPGLYLIQFNADCQVAKLVRQVNDDNANLSFNPLMSKGGGFAAKRRISQLVIDGDGQVTFTGHQSGQELQLAGKKLSNPNQAQRRHSVYVARIKY